MTYYFVEFTESHLSQIFTHFLSKECEVVDEIVRLANEMLAQFRILRSDAKRTGVEVTFTHHHTSEHDKGGSTETILLCTEQSHEHYVSTSLQLSVHLHTNKSAESVFHKSLLCFRQTYFRRNTRKSHARRRAGTRTAFRTRYDYEVGFCLSYTSRDCTHSAFCHEFYAYGSLRVYILQVEDELGKVFY